MDIIINGIVLFGVVFVASLSIMLTFRQAMNYLDSKIREIDKKLDDIKAILSAR